MKIEGAHANFIENSLISSLSLSVKSIEKEIQQCDDHVNTTRGWTLKKLQEILSMNHISIYYNLYYMIMTSILSAMVFQMFDMIYCNIFNVLIKI